MSGRFQVLSPRDFSGTVQYILRDLVERRDYPFLRLSTLEAAVSLVSVGGGDVLVSSPSAADAYGSDFDSRRVVADDVWA